MIHTTALQTSVNDTQIKLKKHTKITSLHVTQAIWKLGKIKLALIVLNVGKSRVGKQLKSCKGVGEALLYHGATLIE